jgi:hypothetical protein
MAKNKNTKFIIIAAVVIIVIAILVLLGNHSPTILILQKSSFTLSPSLAAEYSLSIPQGYNATLTGSYKSNGNLEVGVLNQQELSVFENFRTVNGLNKTYTNLSSSIYYSAQNTSTLHVKLSPGNYSLLFYDPNPQYLQSKNLTYWSQVNITSPIIMNYNR